MKARHSMALAAALLLAGCSADEPPSVPAPVVGSIAGFVVDEALRGIVAANVTVAGNITTTDSNGRFVFDNLTAGTYVVAAEALTYLPRQSTVEVVAGNTTDLRIVLPVNASALAFHQAFTFKGFVDLHGGSQAPELGACRCDFSVPTDGDWLTVIVEAEWTDTVDPGAFETEFMWQVSGGSGVVNGTGPSPLLGRVEAGTIESGATVDIRVAPHSDWAFTNQGFDVVVTVWYGEPAPAGFQVLGTA